MHTGLRRLSRAAVILAACVVVLGAFTRLVDAGLGCPDWPTCYGHLWVPNTADEVALANERFEGTPVEHDKTWPEQAHRIIASLLGVLILVLFGWCTKYRSWDLDHLSVLTLLGALVAGTVARIVVGDAMDPYLWVLVALYFLNVARLAAGKSANPVPYKLPAFIAGLVILQGLFGMWTVTLYLWPKVVTLHLLGGFATLSLLWLLSERLAEKHWLGDAESLLVCMRLRSHAALALVVVAAQIALGGWVSSNYAALACPDFPLCQNALWPEADYREGFNVLQEIGPNYLGGLLDNHARVAIHFSHRLGALAVLAVLGALLWRLWICGFTPARNFVLVLAPVLGLQLLLGVLNVVLALPLWVAVAHNAGGALLLLTLVSLNHRLRTVRSEVH